MEISLYYIAKLLETEGKSDTLNSIVQEKINIADIDQTMYVLSKREVGSLEMKIGKL
ncbi:MAG: hypothetical protein R2741_13705 [Methanolobus sp.]